MTAPWNGLDKAVRVRGDRGERGRRSGERSLAHDLAMAGALGWMIAPPALAGVAAGRGLDRELHGGIVFTSACGFAGTALGCALARRRIHA
jgi:predicted F0F1-ATPase subunit